MATVLYYIWLIQLASHLCANQNMIANGCLLFCWKRERNDNGIFRWFLFHLGMCELTDCPGAQTTPSVSVETTPTNIPHPISLSARVESSAANSTVPQFSSFVEDNELAKGMTPANTDKSTKWVLSNFCTWKEAKNWGYPSDQVPEGLFTCSDTTVLSLHLSRYAFRLGEPTVSHVHQKCSSSSLQTTPSHEEC